MKIKVVSGRTIKILFCVLVLVAVGIGIKSYRNNPARMLQEQLELGMRYLEEMNYEEAILAYEQAIEIAPYCLDAYIGLKDAYILSGQNDKAIEIMETAQKMLPQEETIYIQLSSLYYSGNRMEDSIRILREGYENTGSAEAGSLLEKYETELKQKTGESDEDMKKNRTLEDIEETETVEETEEPDSDESNRYSEYINKIKSCESTYGIAEAVYPSDSFSYMKGLCFLRLIDFDQNGEEELLLVHPEENIADSYKVFSYVYEIWGYIQTEMVLMDTGELFWTDGGTQSVCLTEYEGNSYLVTGSADSFGHYFYHGYSEEGFGVVRTESWEESDDGWENICTVNGKTVSEKELFEEQNKWLGNRMDYALNYYFDEKELLAQIGETKSQLGMEDAGGVAEKSQTGQNIVRAQIYNDWPDGTSCGSHLVLLLEDGTEIRKSYEQGLNGNMQGWYGSVETGDLTGDGLNEVIVNLLWLGSTYNATDVYVYTLKAGQMTEILHLYDGEINRQYPELYSCSGATVENGQLNVSGMIDMEDTFGSITLQYANGEWNKIK